jgi:hypothetical protein
MAPAAVRNCLLIEEPHKSREVGEADAVEHDQPLATAALRQQ